MPRGYTTNNTFWVIKKDKKQSAPELWSTEIEPDKEKLKVFLQENFKEGLFYLFKYSNGKEESREAIPVFPQLTKIEGSNRMDTKQLKEMMELVKSLQPEPNTDFIKLFIEFSVENKKIIMLLEELKREVTEIKSILDDIDFSETDDNSEMMAKVMQGMSSGFVTPGGQNANQ